jgi:hypothetical protein
VHEVVEGDLAVRGGDRKPRAQAPLVVEALTDRGEGGRRALMAAGATGFTAGRMGISVTVALAPERASLASGRAVATTSLAVVLAPLTVGTMADATSLKAALVVVTVALALATAALTIVDRALEPARAAGRA